MNYRIFYYILGIILFVSGCSVGPRYVTPDVSLPSQWANGSNKPSLIHQDAWWHHFHDPLLNELIEQQAISNLNLQTAKIRVRTAQAAYKLTAAQLFPTARFTGLPPSGNGSSINQLMALTTALDPDFFGKIRQSKQRAQAYLNIARAEQHHALINLYTEIASSYLELREVQTKERILQQHIASNKKILQFIKSQYKAGYTNYIHIAQQEGLIETQLAEFEQNKAHISAMLYKIELLTGKAPGTLAKKLLPFSPLPELSEAIHLGMPSQLLRRRPDIIAAEQQVAAAHTDIRIAMANLFPQVNVGWLLGWQTETLASNILTVKNPDATFFGTFNAPFFDLSLYRTIDLRKREKLLAVLNYQITILTALHDVETYYDLCQHYKISLKHLSKAKDQKNLVLHLLKDSYQKGNSDFNRVFRAEEEQNQMELTYLHNKVLYQIAKINLYKALGDGITDTKMGNKKI